MVTEGARMVFSVISFRKGMTRAERDRAAQGAPPCTEAPAPYAELLERSGWTVATQLDVTPQFADITERELAAFESRADRLLALLGQSELSERLALRRAKVAGIHDGLIRRETFVARPRTRR